MKIDIKFAADVAEVRIDDFAKFTVWSFRKEDQEGVYQEVHAYSWTGPKGFNGDDASYHVFQDLCGSIDGEFSEQNMRDFIAAGVKTWADRIAAQAVA